MVYTSSKHVSHTSAILPTFDFTHFCSYPVSILPTFDAINHYPFFTTIPIIVVAMPKANSITTAPAVADSPKAYTTSIASITTPTSDHPTSATVLVTIPTKPHPSAEKTHSRDSLPPNSSLVQPICFGSRRPLKKLKNTIVDVVDLTHLPDSPKHPKPLRFEVQEFDIVLYFPEFMLI